MTPQTASRIDRVRLDRLQTLYARLDALAREFRRFDRDLEQLRAEVTRGLFEAETMDIPETYLG
jgi:hypothetical protein